MDHVGRTDRERAKLEAARWVLRLSAGTLADTEHAEFDRWLKASVHHQVAFEWERLAWERTERLQALRPPGAGCDPLLLRRQGVGDAADADPAEGPRPWHRRFWHVAAVAAGVLVVAGAAWLLSTAHLPEASVYTTGVGERLIVDLDDGSRIELNTNSELAVTYTPSGRDIELVRGESLFDVEHDPDRPFRVKVGERTVRAVGTAFNIRRDENETRILVTDGIVELAGDRGPDGQPFSLQLAAGSIAIDEPRGVVARVIAAGELERALSWRFGSIILAGETLAEAAGEFNRYNVVRLAVADPAIADIRLGGYFNARDVESFVEVLASTYALDVTVEGDRIALRGTAETAARVAGSGMAERPM